MAPPAGPVQDHALLAGVLGAVFGSVIGALAGAFGSYRFQTESERKMTRRELTAQTIEFAHEYLAGLIDYNTACHMERPRRRFTQGRCLAKFARLDGRWQGINARVWDAFAERQVRAAVHRLSVRAISAKLYMIESNCNDEQMTAQAVQWVRDHVSDTFSVMSKYAGVDTVAKGGPYFVGFRRVTEEDYRALSFDDESPPWLSQDEEHTSKEWRPWPPVAPTKSRPPSGPA